MRLKTTVGHLGQVNSVTVLTKGHKTNMDIIIIIIIIFSFSPYGAIFHTSDINFFNRGEPIWQLVTNRNICCQVLLRKHTFIPRATHKH